MQIRRTASRGKAAEAIAEGFIARRRRRKALKQCAQVQTSSSCNDRQLAAIAYIGNRRARMSRIVARGAGFIRPIQIETMMRNTGTFLGARLRRPNLHQPIHRNRIAADNFSIQRFSQLQSKRSFATGSWPRNDKQRRQGCHQPCTKTRPNPARIMLASNTTIASKINPRTTLRASSVSRPRKYVLRSSSARSSARVGAGIRGGSARSADGCIAYRPISLFTRK